MQAMRQQCHFVVNGLELAAHRDISLYTGSHPAPHKHQVQDDSTPCTADDRIQGPRGVTSRPSGRERQGRGTRSLPTRHSAAHQQFLGTHALGSACRPDLPHTCSALAQVNLGFAPSSSGTVPPSPSTVLRKRRTKRPAQPRTSLCFRRKCATLQASQQATVPVSVKRGESTGMARHASPSLRRPGEQQEGPEHQITNSLIAFTEHKILRKQGRR